MAQMKDVVDPRPAEPRDAFLSRVRLRNFKSIGKCDTTLGPLTLLVGRNGAGKSNFLDALRFVAESLQSSVDHAIKSRGGITAVRRRSTGHPRNFSVELEVGLPEELDATYAFEIAARGRGGFVVKRENLQVRSHDAVVGSYRIAEGRILSSHRANMPPATADRLYLVNAAGLPEFRDVYDGLLSMGVYNLNPEAMKELQSPDAGELLHRDGANIASVVGRLTSKEPRIMERISLYLAKIVPDITAVERIELGHKETLKFRQEVIGSDHPWGFPALSMSDGTLRTLGTLVAVMQLAELERPVRLVGIEEPETALHPAAAGALMDALREAASHTQILVTSHSPDLLDQIEVSRDGLLAVRSSRGDTQIAPIDAASRKAIRDHLYTPGELLRMDQLEPDEQDIKRQEQPWLFDIDSEPSL